MSKYILLLLLSLPAWADPITEIRSQDAGDQCIYVVGDTIIIVPKDADGECNFEIRFVERDDVSL